MSTITPVIPSGLTDGQALLVAQTATAGDTFHTAHATALDEVWMWAMNKHTATVVLTVEYGGAGAGQNLKVDLAPNEIALVLPGARLTNSKTVKAFAGTTNVIALFGNVNRYTA